MTYPTCYTPAEHDRAMDRMLADLGLRETALRNDRAEAAVRLEAIGARLDRLADDLDNWLAAAVASLTPAELAERVARQRGDRQ